jgi:hypothetical protein
VAVETSQEGQPLRLHLHVVTTHDGEAAEVMSRVHLKPGTRVVSDGLGCIRAGTQAVCVREPINVTKADHHGEKAPLLPMGITVLGSLKTALAGTLGPLAKRYVPR